MKKRYWIGLSLIGMIVSGFFLFPPVLPVVQLPGEVYPFAKNFPIGEGWTNTMTGTIVAWVLLILFVVSVRARSRSADEVPTGWYNLVEAALEGAFNYVEGLAGKWAKSFFPFFITFILLILIANWIELVPGVDSIGHWENLPHFRAEKAVKELKAEGLELSHEQEEELIHDIEEEIDEQNVGDLRRGIILQRASTNAAGEKPEDADWTIVPYIRAAATDLNFTLALALISVIFTQYYGFKANGFGYLGKFFTFNADKIARNPLGLMDTLVGILEFVSEVAKILSFAFRLFGNIFAGQVLLFVIGFLAPVANLGVFGLELFVGLIQAAVFALLTLTFMSQAVQEAHH